MYKWPFADHERCDPSYEASYIGVVKILKAIHREATSLPGDPEELDAVTFQLPYQLGQEPEAVYAESGKKRRREAQDSRSHQPHECTSTDDWHRLHAAPCCPVGSNQERSFAEEYSGGIILAHGVSPV